MAVWLPPHHVLRPRLVARLVASRVALVEAGAGFGKSTLAAEAGATLGVALCIAPLEDRDTDAGLVAVRLHRALRRSGLSDLAAPMSEALPDPAAALDALSDALLDRVDPVVLVIDDLHNAPPEAARLIAGLARDVSSPHRIWLLGRRLPQAIDVLGDGPQVERIAAKDLGFTRAEARELCLGLLGDEGPADALVRTSGGWVAAVVLGAIAAAQGQSPASLELRGDARDSIADLVLAALGRLDQADRAGLTAISRLPRLSVEVADAASQRPGILARASSAGLPLTRGPAGWWELPGPVVDFLAATAPADPAAARRAAPLLLAAGEPRAAIDGLLAAGADEDAAHLLAELPPEAIERLDELEMLAAVSALSAQAVRAAPEVLLHLARACENGSMIVRRTEALARAEAIAIETGNEVLGRAVLAERARDVVRDGDAADAERMARELLDAAGSTELSTRARAALVLGTALVRHGVRTDDARPVLEEAHRLALAAGRREWAVQAWTLLAIGVDMALGRNADAIARVDEALELLPTRSGQRAVVLTLRAELLNESGRYDEAHAALDEARRLASDLRLPRAHAYAAWEAARTASQTGDGPRVVALLREAEQHSGEWFAKETGAIFLADSADILARVGLADPAREYLTRAVDRRCESPFVVSLAEGAVEARCGDPEVAERALAAAAADTRRTPREEWRIDLFRAHAARRRGTPNAADLAVRAFAAAAALGNPDLPLIRERAIAEGLLDLVRAAGGDAPEPETLTPRIRALGLFALTRGGAGITLPPGRPDLVVKFLVAHGGRALTEEVIESLWPEVEPTSGRKRLRNALSRLRAAAGELVVRDGESLMLAAEVDVDAVVFEQAARRALASQDGDERAAAARAAVGGYGGDLLPDEAYETWAAAPRERLRGRLLGMFDLLIADAESRGDLDEAVRILERASEADPLDDARLVRLASVLLAQGRRAAAESALRRAEAVLADLALDPSPAIAAMRRTFASKS
jgi:LuxR family transcriptional regulator, maltose regulon positive regulatory protein